MKEDLPKQLTENQKEIKESMDEMKTSIQTVNNRLDHMEGRVSLSEKDQSKIEHTIYNLEKKFNSMNRIWRRYGLTSKEQT